MDNEGECVRIKDIVTRFGDVVDGKTLRQKDCVDVSRITRNLFLGSYEQGASGYDGLKVLGITHILTVGHKMPAVFPDKFTYKIIKLRDDKVATIENHFEECVEFIDEAVRENSSNRILVHCWV